MADLAELYSTYLDSRSVLANQFDITRQIMNDVRHRLNEGVRSSVSLNHERFNVDMQSLSAQLPVISMATAVDGRISETERLP